MIFDPLIPLWLKVISWMAIGIAIIFIIIIIILIFTDDRGDF